MNTQHNHTHHKTSNDNHYKHCDICNNSLAYCSCATRNIENKVYKIENLDCANCGAKIEHKLLELPAVEDCSIIFSTKQMKLSAPNQSELLPEIIGISQSIEPDVTFTPTDDLKSKTYTFVVEGLDCPNCTKKLEDKINKLDGVSNANVSMEAGIIKLESLNSRNLLNRIQAEADTLEEGITVHKKEVKRSTELSNQKESKFLKRESIELLVGSLIFIFSWIFESRIGFYPELILQAIAYLLLGGEVLKTAFKNITKGNFFDENFLMSIATLAAFAIGDFHEGVGVMLFYRVGEYFEEVAVERSRKQIMTAVDMRPETVNLIVNDEIEVLPAEEAQVGDILLIRPGDRIPLDSVIIEGTSRIDTSAVTGEPVPVAVKPEDELISGTVNQNGQLKVRVIRELQESMVTKILESVENAAANKPKVDRFITKFSRIYTPCVVALSAAIAIIPPLFDGNWYHWIYTAVSFLVISCPCALVLSVPLAYFCGIGAASKLGILFKGGSSIEVLSNIKAIVFDKTGTLTKGNFEVQKINAVGLSKNELLSIAADCEINSTHPIAQSIVEAAKKDNIKVKAYPSIEEIAGKGIIARDNSDIIYCGNIKLLKEAGINLSAYQPSEYGTEVLIARNKTYLGSIEISDTIKPETEEVIEFINKNGIETVMLTGDAKKNAANVSKTLGIKSFFAELLPEDKLSQLNKIRQKFGSVMFVGDGINDSPVLAGADIGAAIGSGTDAAIEASDLVLMNDSLNSIKQAYQIGRKTYRIAWQNIVLALVIKAIIILLGLFGYANMWLAVFADTGVAILCILNSIRILNYK